MSKVLKDKLYLQIYNDIDRLLTMTSKYEELEAGDSLELVLNCSGHLEPSVLCILVAWIKHMENKGVSIKKYINQTNTYASRINFYKHIGVDIEENFCRHNPTGRFVEITNTNKINTNQIVNDTMEVIGSNMDLDKSVFDCLNYCLHEVIDNINEHSNSDLGGYVVVQNFPKKEELVISIVDEGIGIKESLKRSGKTEFQYISEPESLSSSIKLGITGTNETRGKGLYHTSEFIKANKGTMKIFSGNTVLIINKRREKASKVDHWQGVIFELVIKTNNPINFIDVFGSEINIPTSVSEADDVLAGYL